jgi:cyclophilin family peptidyl-prolyl cis-trans isomerase
MPPNRKTRDRQLRKLHERRLAERRKQQRQRALTMIVASVLVVALAVGLVLILTNRGKKSAASPTTPHPTATSHPATPTAPASPGSNCGYTQKDEATGDKGAQPLPTFAIDVTKKYTATVETSMGTFVVALDAQAAPCTVNSFVYLAERHFFDGLIFHRIIKGFVIQGGDPTGTGSGGPGYSFNDELNNNLNYNVGALAMANSGPNTNGSQWFVVTGAQGVALAQHPNYTIFGMVTKGLSSVVLKISNVKTGQSDRPVTDVVMTKVTISS